MRKDRSGSRKNLKKTKKPRDKCKLHQKTKKAKRRREEGLSKTKEERDKRVSRDVSVIKRSLTFFA